VGKARCRWDVDVWRDHVEAGERRSGRPCPENWPKNYRRRISGRWKKLEQALLKPGTVISDAPVVLPRKHSDRESNRTGNTESTRFRGFVVLCRQGPCDELMCSSQLYLTL